MGGAQLAMQRAIEQGDLTRGVQPIGQVQGLVRDAPPVAEIIRRVMGEAESAVGGLSAATANTLARSES